MSCPQPGLTHGLREVPKAEAGEGSDCHLVIVAQTLPGSVSPQLVCITANFHMLCEAQCKQLMLCSICTMTFYWKELETPSGQK